MGSAKHLLIDDADSNANTDANADSNADPNPNPDSDTNAESDPVTNADAVTGTADLPFRPSRNDTVFMFTADVAAVERQRPLT